MKARTAVSRRSHACSADGRGPLRWCATLALGIAAPCGVLSAPTALAAQTDVVLSMAGPGAAPRIHGPSVIGGKPGAPFLYTIPATGTKPLTYSATGLPAGLTLNAATGTMAGTTPAAGAYPLTLGVSSGAGSDSRVVTLEAGNTLALTPPMGWNSYDSFGATVTESETMAAAQAQLALLQPFGWSYVVVDYLWFTPEGAIDANGRYLPSISKFPSATGSLGLKPLADKVHSLGLSFGIHIMRGIPRMAVAANSPIAGSTYTAANAANTIDRCPWDSHMWGVHGDTAAGQAWYDSIFAQYAAWGVDFVKVDDMINNQVTPLVYHANEVSAIRNAIDKTGRAIVLSLSPGPMQTADAASLGTHASMWRMVNDFWDVKGLSTVADVFTASGRWQGVSGLGAGHWPDADMLPLGYLGPRCPVHASGASALSHNEQVSVMSLWAILPSPLVFGGNVPMLATDATTGPWTLALLTNDEVLAVNQDAGGNRATLVAQSGSTQVWAKDLSGGRKAVAFFNRGNADAPVPVTLAQLGLSGTVLARDLWKRTDLGPISDSLDPTVPWLGASLMILSPATAGTPDAGTDAGSTGGNGAIPPDAMTLAGGSSSGGGGSSGSSGSSGASASGGGAHDAGGPSDGIGSSGGNASGSGGGPGQGNPPSSSGCSVSAAGASSPRGGWLCLLGLTGMAVAARRRRRGGNLALPEQPGVAVLLSSEPDERGMARVRRGPTLAACSARSPVRSGAPNPLDLEGVSFVDLPTPFHRLPGPRRSRSAPRPRHASARLVDEAAVLLAVDRGDQRRVQLHVEPCRLGGRGGVDRRGVESGAGRDGERRAVCLGGVHARRRRRVIER